MASAKDDIHIVKINGLSFVSGLLWEPLAESRTYMREVRQIGKSEDMDLALTRSGSAMMQAGFASRICNVSKGMYSLAAAMAGQIKQESWIGVFKLPGGDLYVLIAVHAGLVVPGYDVIGERQEIYDLLVERDSQPKIMKFDKVYRPDEFEYDGVSLDLEDILMPATMRKEYALKPLTFRLTKRDVTRLSLAVATLIVLLIAYTQWTAYQQREAAKEAQRQEQVRLKKLEELNARTGSDQSLTALEHPWASMAGIADFLNGCEGAIGALPLSLGGWMFDSALCNSRTIESVYGRSGKTTFNDLLWAAQGRFPSAPVLLEGAERAGFGDEIKLGAGGDDELLPFDVLQANFTSYLQALDLKAAIVPVAVKAPVPPALPGQQPSPRPLLPSWKKFSFTLTSPYAPRSIFFDLNLPGVRLTEIAVTRTGTQLSWSLKGEIYAR